MNVTPLVDVVLVLLIIFMIVIPAMEEGLNLEVPVANNPDEETEDGPEPVMLAITRTGGVFLQERRVPDGELDAHLSAAHRAHPHRRLVLRGDRGVDYGRVRELFEAAQTVGFPGISLRVNYVEGAAASGEEN